MFTLNFNSGFLILFVCADVGGSLYLKNQTIQGYKFNIIVILLRHYMTLKAGQSLFLVTDFQK